jgi:large subunit ribosomal protein L27
MAHKKAGGSTKNISDSKPKFLGTKLYSGQQAKAGNVIVRQRGTRIVAGKNVRIGKDHTLYAGKEGTIAFRTVRKTRFDGRKITRKEASIA